MKAKEIAKQEGLNQEMFESFIHISGIKFIEELDGISIDDTLDIKSIVENYHQYIKDLRAKEKEVEKIAYEASKELRKKGGMDLSLIEFAETRQKNIEQFASWLQNTNVSGVLKDCDGSFEKLRLTRILYIDMCLGICDDELIIYENKLLSKPDRIYAINLSDIIWDQCEFSEELGYVNFKFINVYSSNIESFSLGRLSTGSWNLNEFVNKVNELFPGAIKNGLSDENVRFIEFKKTQTKVKFDHAKGIFELYKIDSKYAPMSGRIYDLIADVKYSDILNCELIEDSVSVMKGGLAAAAVGGVIFGGVGAIVGANVGSKTSREILGTVSIKVSVNNINNSFISIPLFSPGIIKNYKKGAVYEEWIASVNEVLGMFAVVLSNNSKKKDADPAPQITIGADDIRKYKQLLDDGIITKEEFDEVKKRILAL